MLEKLKMHEEKKNAKEPPALLWWNLFNLRVQPRPVLWWIL